MDKTKGLEQVESVYTLLSRLQRAEERAQREGWIDMEDVEKELESCYNV